MQFNHLFSHHLRQFDKQIQTTGDIETLDVCGYWHRYQTIRILLIFFVGYIHKYIEKILNIL